MFNDYKLISHNIKGEKITIIPLADLHIGASGCKIDEIKKIIKHIKETDNCYTVIAGDVLDNAVITGKCLGMFDNIKSPMKQIEEAVELFRPIKDKILGIVSGNHEGRSENIANINPLYMIACELGIQEVYRSNLAIVKVQLGGRYNTKETGGRRQCYTILVHHGKGSSETAIKKDYEFIKSFEGADIIVTGHTHNGRVAKFNKKIIDTRNNKIVNRQITIIVCNSFMEDVDYALKSMLVGCSNDLISFDLTTGNNKNVLVHY